MLNNFSYGPIWSFAGGATFALKGVGWLCFSQKLLWFKEKALKLSKTGHSGVIRRP